MTEPQQSDLYARYITTLGWSVERIDSVYIFVRKFPLIGGIIKIHRPEHLPPVEVIIQLIRTHHIRTVVIEPTLSQNQRLLDSWCTAITQVAKIAKTPFLPTKTIRIDLTPPEDRIFQLFSEAKRRAVRRAIKLGVVIEESNDIRKLISVKNKSAGLFGFITTSGIKELWPIFAPKHASILIAKDHNNIPFGGVLLIHYSGVTYYWIAGATKHGKRLFAPTLLAWESMRIAKRHTSKLFDFVGVWDERIPHENTEWKGFTKFKEGFGGVSLYYPLTAHK